MVTPLLFGARPAHGPFSSRARLVSYQMSRIHMRTEGLHAFADHSGMSTDWSHQLRGGDIRTGGAAIHDQSTGAPARQRGSVREAREH